MAKSINTHLPICKGHVVRIAPTNMLAQESLVLASDQSQDVEMVTSRETYPVWTGASDPLNS